jgi:hypothetical protein
MIGNISSTVLDTYCVSEKIVQFYFISIVPHRRHNTKHGLISKPAKKAN